MVIRRILRYSRCPSHSFTFAAPCTRLLVEIESPSYDGCVVGNVINVLKTVDERNVVTGIELKQLNGKTPKGAERYVAACWWWLHRRPFSAARLPVKLTARTAVDSIMNVNGLRVTSLDASRFSRAETLGNIDLAALVTRFPHLKELDMSSTSACHLGPLAQLTCLESLRADDCESLRDLTPLSACTHLKRLSVSRTAVADLGALGSQSTDSGSLTALDISHTPVCDLGPLRDMVSLAHLRATSCAALRDLTPLQRCGQLTLLHVSGTQVSDLTPLENCDKLEIFLAGDCQRLRDLSPLRHCSRLTNLGVWSTAVADVGPLRGMTCLETVDANNCAELRDVFPLGECPQLTGVYLSGTHVSDLTPLAGLAWLVEIDAYESDVASLAGLNRCPRLRKIDVQKCRSLRDVSALAGAPSLEEVYAQESGVLDANGLEACPNLKVLKLSGAASRWFTPTI